MTLLVELNLVQNDFVQQCNTAQKHFAHRTRLPIVPISNSIINLSTSGYRKVVLITPQIVTPPEPTPELLHIIPERFFKNTNSNSLTQPPPGPTVSLVRHIFFVYKKKAIFN